MTEATKFTLDDLAPLMRDIDFALLTTQTEDGRLASRPMSNNAEVDYDGNSFYFAWEDSRLVRDIRRSPHVGLGFQASKGILGKPPMFIAVQGEAEVFRDKATFADHWTHGLEHWFTQGVDTPGVAMIKVHAKRIHCWNGVDQGEVLLPDSTAG